MRIEYYSVLLYVKIVSCGGNLLEFLKDKIKRNMYIII